MLIDPSRMPQRRNARSAKPEFVSDPVLTMNAAHPIRLGVIGVGQLAEHLVEGLCGSSSPSRVLLSPRSKPRAQSLAERYSLEVALDNQAVVDGSDVVILSVPPDEAADAAKALAFEPQQVVICVAAGIKRENIAKAAAPATTVRAMPVTSASVRESATALHPGNDAATAILNQIGTVHAFDREEDFEVAMVIATYYGWVYGLMAEVSGWLEDRGLDGSESAAMVAQMTRGACAMCLEGGKDMATEAREIGRPGTYTGMGLDLLQRMDALSAWRETLDAVLEATRRGSAD